MKWTRWFYLLVFLAFFSTGAVSAKELLPNITIDDTVYEQLLANQSLEIPVYPVTLSDSFDKIQSAITSYYAISKTEESTTNDGNRFFRYTTDYNEEIILTSSPFMQTTSVAYSKYPAQSIIPNIASDVANQQGDSVSPDFSLSLNDEVITQRIKDYLIQWGVSTNLHNIRIHRLSAKNFQDFFEAYNKDSNNQDNKFSLPDNLMFEDLYYVTAERAIDGYPFLTNEQAIGNPDVGNHVVGESYRFILNQNDILDAYLLDHYHIETEVSRTTVAPAKVVDFLQAKYTDLLATNPIHIDQVTLSYAPVVSKSLSQQQRVIRIEPVWIVHIRVKESNDSTQELFDMNLFFSPITEKELLQ